jgi:hypothetical protein
MVLQLPTRLRALATAIACAVVCGISVDPAQALSCLTRTPRADLTSEPAYWTIVLPSGVECTQAFRYPPLVIGDVTIVTAPRQGSLIVDGPSFRYSSNPTFKGPDAFVISVSGSSGRVTDSTFIYVDVMVR